MSKENVKITGFNEFMDLIEDMKAGCEGLKELDGKIIVSKSQVVEKNVVIDKDRLSNSREEAKREADYLKAIEDNKIETEDQVLKLARDIINDKGKGLI